MGDHLLTLAEFAEIEAIFHEPALQFFAAEGAGLVIVAGVTAPVTPPVRPRRIYVAGCLERRAEAAVLARILTHAGHVVTSRWHDDAAITRTGDAVFGPATRRLGAAAQATQIEAAEVVLWLADARSCGGLFELGLACGLRRRVIALGDWRGVTPLAHAPGVTWPAADATLETLLAQEEV